MSLIPQNTGVKFVLGIVFICVIFAVFYSKYRESHTPVFIVNSKITPLGSGNAENVLPKMEDGVLNLGTTTEVKKIKGGYFEYSESYIKKADSNNRIVLFFNASWSPVCQELDKEFSGADIPEGLVVLSVDYDSYTTLKKKYEITREASFVVVDSEGNVIKKWVGGSLKDIISKI